MRPSVKDSISLINLVRHVNPICSKLEPYILVNGAEGSVMATASKPGLMVQNILVNGKKTGLKEKESLFM